MKWLPLIAVAAACGGAPARPTARVDLAVHAAHMIDVVSGRVVEDAVVTIAGGRVVAAGPAREVPLPAGTRTVELGAATLLPGLIDAHVHLAWGAPTDREVVGAAEARATLEAGFTTVRNLGSTADGDLALRDAIAAGRVVGPRVLAAGLGIGAPGGACSQVFGPQGDATSAADVTRLVNALIARHVDVIKLCAGGGVLAGPGDATAVELDEAAMRAAVEAAHAHGLKVAVHAQGPAAIAAAARAGVDSIEHGGLIDAETARLLVEKHVFLVPTLHRIDHVIRQQRAAGAPVDRVEAARKAAFDGARAAVAAGVRIALGSDATVMPHGHNAEELAALVEIGLTPLAALRAATIDAAELLGLGERAGRIAPGADADLVAVRGDPLADVAALKEVVFVMKGGAVVRAP